MLQVRKLKPICFKLHTQAIRVAEALSFVYPGARSATRMASATRTISNSGKLNARLKVRCDEFIMLTCLKHQQCQLGLRNLLPGVIPSSASPGRFSSDPHAFALELCAAKIK